MLDRDERKRNLDSLRRIPSELISADERLRYISYAARGQDVYAYRSSAKMWNIWDGFRRIELGEAKEDLVKRMHVNDARRDE